MRAERRPSGVSIGPGCAGRYVCRNSANGRSPMKQMPGAVALVVNGQRVLVRDATHFALGQDAHREQRAGEHRAGHGVQEITLVLGRRRGRAAGEPPSVRA